MSDRFNFSSKARKSQGLAKLMAALVNEKLKQSLDTSNYDRCLDFKDEIEEVIMEVGNRDFYGNEEVQTPMFLIDLDSRLWDVFPIGNDHWIGQCEELDISFTFGPAED